MSSQLFVTLYTLYIFPSAHNHLSRRHLNPFGEFPCIYKFSKWLDFLIIRRLQIKVIRKFFILAYTIVSPKKYFAKNLEFCGPRNLLFSTAASATNSKFLAKYYFGLTKV